MAFVIEQRSSDSPLATTVWRSDSGDVTQFMSLASTALMMVVTKQDGRRILTWRGPETKATLTDCPENAEFFGVIFEPGSFVPAIPSQALVDGTFDLSDSGGQSFWLHGRSWQFPTFENVDTFLERLVHEELLSRDSMVEAVIRDETLALSSRTVQRRFLHATGISHRTYRQIKRARHAVTLLKDGASILDAVEEAGYADQSHMTRALKRFAGQTPAELAR